MNLEERKSGIGGSDAPVVVLGEYFGKTVRDLFLEKTGVVPPPTVETPDMRRGKRQEAIAARLFEETTGEKLRRVNTMLRHPQHDWMIAHIDRLVQGRDAIVEIKCPRVMTFRKWQLEGIPEGPQIQGQHYLAVKGRGAVIFAVFCAELDDLLVVPVERDDDLIDLIQDKERQFWAWVEAGEMPPAPEIPSLKEDIPPVGGELVRIETAEWFKAAEALRAAKELRAEVEELEKQAKNKILHLMGDAQVAEGGGLRVYYRKSPGRKTLDKKALQAAYPQINLDDFMRVGESYYSFRPYFLA